MDPKNSKPESEDAPYSAFSPKQRTMILTVVCIAGLTSPLSSLMYTPALPAIANSLGVSISDINLTVTVYLIFQGITPSIWGSIGDVYGRRVVYVITLLITVGASIGLCLTESFAVVLVLRAVHATGCSSTRALGAGVIRDIVPPNIRGGYMGVYSAGVGVGTAFGPFLGGLLAQYASWHGIFWFLAALAIFSAACVVLFLPETLRPIVGNGSIAPPKYLRPLLPWLSPSPGSDLSPRHGHGLKPKIDLLGSLRIMKYPDVLSGLVFTGICYTVWQNSMVATSTIYALEYGLDEADIGLTYLSNGFGSLIGNIIIGKILDRDYQKYLNLEGLAAGEQKTARRSLMFIEKARLRSLTYNAPLFVAFIILFGWIIQIHAPVAASITIAFFIGWLDSAILTTYSTLFVDLFPDAASTSSSSINLVRCLLGAVGTSTIQLMITAMGVGWSFTTLGGICVLASPLIWLQCLYGPKFRARRYEDGFVAQPEHQDTAQVDVIVAQSSQLSEK
ncbi:MFS general substrate transporter [Gymnopus androsaceus JB14]|uniref:MFS general substrate transporter n=1 Tax=Gymnopus androsaceus JB14 TaxID=1447944 RepID=A0A6A4I8F4_9AGAR|nr:MFS general substrate transporter [Gymnopus androsaceus JB14]